MISFREKDYMYSYNAMMPRSFDMHLHRYYEFLYFVSGDATYIVEDSEYRAQSGDLFITRPNELHSIVFHSPMPYERHFVQISDAFLAGEDFDMLKRIRSYRLGSGNRISHEALLGSDIAHYFNEISRYVINRTPESDLMIKTYVILILSLVNSLLPSPPEIHIETDERVARAKKYIDENISMPLSLDDIARAVFCDKFYLCHLFRCECAMSIKEYITLRRLSLAKRLLSDGGCVSSVYTECGFRDYSTFYRAFRKISGKSPKEFMESLKSLNS